MNIPDPIRAYDSPITQYMGGERRIVGHERVEVLVETSGKATFYYFTTIPVHAEARQLTVKRSRDAQYDRALCVDFLKPRLRRKWYVRCPRDLIVVDGWQHPRCDARLWSDMPQTYAAWRSFADSLVTYAEQRGALLLDARGYDHETGSEAA